MLSLMRQNLILRKRHIISGSALLLCGVISFAEVSIFRAEVLLLERLCHFIHYDVYAQ